MGEVALTDTQIVLPITGALVDRADPAACARALRDLRDAEDIVRDAKRALTAALEEHAALIGTRTFQLDGIKVTLPKPEETVYDAELVEAGLRRAGMPEDRLREIVKETVSYRVDAAKAKAAASANPKYGRVIARHSRKVPKTVSPTIEVQR